jgi:hypothetical protein
VWYNAQLESAESKIMPGIDWTIVIEVAVLGFVVLFIVIGVVAFVVWLVSFGITKLTKNKISQN